MDKKKILVVDDDKVVTTVISHMLSEAGYEVHKVENGEDAIAFCSKIIAEEIPIDLVILDYGMPEVNGIDVAKFLRDNTIPFIFHSAYKDEKIVKEATQHGALGYILKPIEPEKIEPQIKAAIERGGEIKGLTEANKETRNINIVIGIIMSEFGIDEDEAKTRMISYCRSQRIKTIDYANVILNKHKEISRLKKEIHNLIEI